MAASTVRQIHSIISATLSAAVRWEWISSNPAHSRSVPGRRHPSPNPPSAADAARLLDAAFGLDDWGALVCLVMTTGMRRGEVCALRWRDVDFDTETVEVRRSYILHRGVDVEKATKTHQMRRIVLDSDTVVLLREARDRVRARLDLLGAPFSASTYLFTCWPRVGFDQRLDPCAGRHRFAARHARGRPRNSRRSSAPEPSVTSSEIRVSARDLG
jgi:integrase